ncbi:hypothetical protein B0J13DRAFT_445283 [Dactylonectria estremocensis]|uniref:Uncharacterized protein n=1 Tax=Dactylonectria estremocensis TaxID=1079267 RepID=A0A9P9EQK7_9HYPO|nr:hypothetical protein B0J13DRAFT_445283 [Dactylonectria estremocensis]
MEILCSICRLFHLPRLTDRPTSNEAEAARPCCHYGNKWIQQRTASRNLPVGMHFDMVAAMTRSSRHQALYYKPRMIEKRSHYSYLGVSPHLDLRHAVRIVDGHFLVRKEICLYPDTMGSASLYNVPNFLKMMTSLEKVENCCEHVKWIDTLDFLFDPTLKTWAKHLCLWTHPERCKRLGPEGLGSMCQWPVGTMLHTVYSCRVCYTGYSIGRRDVVDGSTTVTFTSWKDLGCGKDIDDQFWKSHLSRIPGYKTVVREGPLGDIWSRFEGSTRPYVPRS